MKPKIQKTDDLNDFFDRSFYSSFPIGKPLPRFVNGFRLFSLSVSDESYIEKFYWCIRPNNTSQKFYFRTLSAAMDFAKRYRNCHSDKFWFNLKAHYPMFSEYNVLAYLTENDFFL